MDSSSIYLYLHDFQLCVKLAARLQPGFKVADSLRAGDVVGCVMGKTKRQQNLICSGTDSEQSRSGVCVCVCVCVCV